MPQLCVAICWRSATVPAKGNGREPPGQSLEATEQKELLLTTQLPHGHEQPLHPPHIPTLAVGALLRAFASSLLALSYSLFSDSSLTAASQISSLLGLACENTKWQTNASSESTADLIPRFWSRLKLKSELCQSTLGLFLHFKLLPNFFDLWSSQKFYEADAQHKDIFQLKCWMPLNCWKALMLDLLNLQFNYCKNQRVCHSETLASLSLNKMLKLRFPAEGCEKHSSRTSHFSHNHIKKSSEYSQKQPRSNLGNRTLSPPCWGAAVYFCSSAPEASFHIRTVPLCPSSSIQWTIPFTLL